MIQTQLLLRSQFSLTLESSSHQSTGFVTATTRWNTTRTEATEKVLSCPSTSGNKEVEALEMKAESPEKCRDVAMKKREPARTENNAERVESQKAQILDSTLSLQKKRPF